MDVSQFTQEVLSQIAEGVKQAKGNQNIKAVGTTNHNAVKSNLGEGLIQDSSGQIYTVVNFDMAVTVIDEAGGGGGIKVPFFDLSAAGKHQSETVSRVKFSIPIKF